jgi:hypothetical protein
LAGGGRIDRRKLVLIAAVVIFIVAIFVGPEHAFDWLAAGLACTSAAVLVRELGWDRRVGPK